MTRPAVVSVILAASIAAAAGADARQRAYQADAADEDWSFLAQAPRADWWDALKFVPLGGDDWYVTLSGQARLRPEGFRVRPTETRAATVDSYVLQRYLFGAHVQLGARARVFTELQSGTIAGQLRSPRPTDRNTLDLHQAFAEWRPAVRDGDRLSIKAGRQQLSIGSTRLVSASPGLNVKRSFDGVVAVYHRGAWTFAGAGARLVGVGGGSFDDWSGAGHRVWGAAASRRVGGSARQAGGYVLRSRSRRDLAGAGVDRRVTAGVKWTAAGPRLHQDYDLVLQWGGSGRGTVRAWAMATETSYQLSVDRWGPRLIVRVNGASGDRRAGDGRDDAFNPLFPGNAYAGAVGLLGPTNLADVTPALAIRPRRDLAVSVEMPAYWRLSGADGIYATDLRPLVPPAAGEGRYVGANPGVVAAWQATPHWQMQGALTRFFSGGFLSRTFVAPGFTFYSASAVYRF